MNQNQDQKNFKMSLPTIINFKQNIDSDSTCIFYFNFTSDSLVQDKIKSNNFNIIESQQEGFIGQTQESIYIFYFQNLVVDQNNDQINYSQLIGVKHFLIEFVQRIKLYDLRFVCQINQQQFSDDIIRNMMKQLIEGLFPLDFDLLFLVELGQKQNIRGFYVNLSRKINFEEFIFENDNFEQDEINIIHLILFYSQKLEIQSSYFQSLGEKCIDYVGLLKNEIEVVYSSALLMLESMQQNLNNMKSTNWDTTLSQFSCLCQLLTEKVDNQQDQTFFEAKENQIRHILMCLMEHNKEMNDIIIQSGLLDNGLNILIQDKTSLLEICNYYSKFSQIKQVIQLLQKRFMTQILYALEDVEIYRMYQYLNYEQNLHNLNEFQICEQDVLNQYDQDYTILLLENFWSKNQSNSILSLLLNKPENIKIHLSKENQLILSPINDNQEQQDIQRIEYNNHHFKLIKPQASKNISNYTFEGLQLNQLNLFYKINKSQKIMILFVIEELELQNLTEQIKRTNILFNNQLQILILEDFLQIILINQEQNTFQTTLNQLENELWNIHFNKQELDFVKLIKKKLDNNQYIQIFIDSFSLTSNIQQFQKKENQLTLQILELENQGKEKVIEVLTGMRNRLLYEIDEFKLGKREIQFEFNIQKAQAVKQQILNDCMIQIQRQKKFNLIKLKISLLETLNNQQYRINNLFLIYSNMVNCFINEIKNQLLRYSMIKKSTVRVNQVRLISKNNFKDSALLLLIFKKMDQSQPFIFDLIKKFELILYLLLYPNQLRVKEINFKDLLSKEMTQMQSFFNQRTFQNFKTYQELKDQYKQYQKSNQ